jgi:hypothetical protein
VAAEDLARDIGWPYLDIAEAVADEVANDYALQVQRGRLNYRISESNINKIIDPNYRGDPGPLTPGSLRLLQGLEHEHK